MVKGLARRVVVVKSPDKRVFEEAIFILKDDALKDSGVTAEDVIGEACRVAAEYMRKNNKTLRRLRPLMYAAAGLAAGGIGVFIGTLVG